MRNRRYKEKHTLSRLSNFGFLLILLTALLSAIANLVLRKGIEAAGGFTIEGFVTTIMNFVTLLMNPLFLLGFLLYFGATLFWIRILASEPVSMAYPILVSLSFILVTIGTAFFLKEPILLRTLLGILSIIVGIVLISGWHYQS